MLPRSLLHLLLFLFFFFLAALAFLHLHSFPTRRSSDLALTGFQSLSIGVHWPSTLTEDQFSLLNYAEASEPDRKSTRLNSSHRTISYAVFCLKKKTKTQLALAATPRKQRADLIHHMQRN